MSRILIRRRGAWWRVGMGWGWLSCRGTARVSGKWAIDQGIKSFLDGEYHNRWDGKITLPYSSHFGGGGGGGCGGVFSCTVQLFFYWIRMQGEFPLRGAIGTVSAFALPYLHIICLFLSFWLTPARPSVNRSLPRDVWPVTMGTKWYSCQSAHMCFWAFRRGALMYLKA